jgi:hypothetical protein
MEREEFSVKAGDRVGAREAISPSLARGTLRIVGEAPEADSLARTQLDALPDLSVGDAEEQSLRRSRWAAIVEIRFRGEGLARHQGLLDLVEDRLTGRTPMTRMSGTMFLADFQVSDDGRRTRETVTAFARALGDVLGDSVISTDGRVVKFETSNVDHLLGEEFRSRPYAI